MGKEVKNALRAQSNGLMGSSAKTGNFFIGESQQQFVGSKT